MQPTVLATTERGTARGEARPLHARAPGRASVIDLHSDTQTRPTGAMRAAMAGAAVGDEQAGEDPTTLALCERVAALLGMEGGVFMPSGTMCNLAALLVHTRPGDELICDAQAHIVGTEAAGAAALGGVAVRTIASPHGVFEARQVREAVRAPSRTAPRSALLVVEQTTFSGGAVWPLAQLRAVRDAAREAGLRCHIDGARLLNACAASGVAAAEHVAGWNSAWLDLTKGLGCPVGAVLCGDADFIERAWQWKYRLGGAMRQSGIVAAAGLHALDHHVERLADDHANARLIWRALSASGLFRFDPAPPESNILRFALLAPQPAASDYAARCLRAGVRVRVIDGGFLRATTHLDVSAADAARAAETMLAVARQIVSGSAAD